MCQPKICLQFALRLPSIFPKFSIGSTFVFAHPMSLLVFQSLSWVVQSTLGHVSTNGCRKGWQCSLLISNVVPGISGTIIWHQLVEHIPKRVRSTCEGCRAMGQTNQSKPPGATHNGAHEFAECDVQLAKVLFVDFAMVPCKTSNWCIHGFLLCARPSQSETLRLRSHRDMGNMKT